MKTLSRILVLCMVCSMLMGLIACNRGVPDVSEPSDASSAVSENEEGSVPEDSSEEDADSSAEESVSAGSTSAAGSNSTPKTTKTTSKNTTMATAFKDPTVKSKHLPKVTLKESEKEITLFATTGVDRDTFLSPDTTKGVAATNIYEELYGGRFKTYNVPLDQYYSRLFALRQSQQMPDLLYPIGKDIPYNFINDLIQPVDNLEPYLDLSDPIWDNQRKYIEDLKIAGHHYMAIHEFTSPALLLYNPKAFALADLETPFEIYKKDPSKWDWNKLRDLAKELTIVGSNGKIKQYGLALGGSGGELYGTCGEPSVKMGSIDKGEITYNFNNKYMSEYAAFVYSMGPNGTGSYKNTVDPKEVGFTADRFIAGYDAMAIDYLWRATTVYKDLWAQGKLEVAPLPRYPGKDKNWRGGSTWAYTIANGAKNVKGAALWLTLNAYCNSKYLMEDYGVDNNSGSVAYKNIEGISKEQGQLMYDLFYNATKFPVTVTNGSWTSVAGATLFKYMKLRSWADIYAEYGPQMESEFNENKTEFMTAINKKLGK